MDQLDKYETIESIGHSAHSIVKLIERKKDKKQLILKMTLIPSNLLYTPIMEDVEKEVAILRRFRPPNKSLPVVRLEETFRFEQEMCLYHCIVTEYCKKGNLEQHIRSRDGRPFTQEEILYYFLQITWALSLIHEKNIIHRDLKPSNVFITENKHLKLGDLGSAKRLKSLSSRTLSFNALEATPEYMAPERWRGEDNSTATDMWSLGCVLVSLMELRTPFECKNTAKLVDLVTAADYGELHLHRDSPLLVALVKELLNVDAKSRPKAADLLSRSDLLEHFARLKSRIESSEPKPTTKDQPTEPSGPRFPDPHTEDMITRVQGDIASWQGMGAGLVPILCNAEGRYQVDWSSPEEQWRFGSYKCGRWKKFCDNPQDGHLLGCSLVLPRQLDERIINCWLLREAGRIILNMVYNRVTPDNLPATFFDCKIRIIFPRKGDLAPIVLERQVQDCKVVYNYNAALRSTEVYPFEDFDPDKAPVMELCLEPPPS